MIDMLKPAESAYVALRHSNMAQCFYTVQYLNMYNPGVCMCVLAVECDVPGVASQLTYMDAPSLVPRALELLKNICCVQDWVTAFNHLSWIGDHSYGSALCAAASEGPTRSAFTGAQEVGTKSSCGTSESNKSATSLCGEQRDGRTHPSD